MDRVKITSRIAQSRVASETHGSEKAAVRTSPQANFPRINLGKSLQVSPCGDHIFVFRCSAPNRIRSFAKRAPIHDSEAIVDRQDSVAAATQVLILGVSVVIVVHVVKAEHHLADGASMHEDHSWNFAIAVARQKELPMKRKTIFALEYKLFGNYQLV